MSQAFVPGKTYTRRDVFEIVGVDPDRPGGNWFTGYHKHGEVWFIFCNVGTAGRTGHDYANEWHGDELHWYGKTRSRAHQPAIRDMTGPHSTVRIFYRSDDRAPFTYAGEGRAARVVPSEPVKVVWHFAGSPVDARPPSA